METQVRHEFAAQQIELGDKDEAAVVKLAQMCRRFGVTAEEMAGKWSAFCINNSIDMLPVTGNLDKLAKELELQQKKERGKSHFGRVDMDTGMLGGGTSVISDDFLSAFNVEADTAKEIKEKRAAEQAVVTTHKRANFATPARASARSIAAFSPTAPTTPASGSSSPSDDYDKRPNSGKIEMEYNPEQRTIGRPPMSKPLALDVAIYPNCVEKPYRHMFTKVLDRAEVLDERIDKLGARIIKKHKLLQPREMTADAEEGSGDPPSLASVAVPNQEEVTVVARVCLDAQGEGKLNEQSICLEGSRMTSDGERVHLNLASMPVFSMFPGQVIACNGVNTTGVAFAPTQIFQGAPLPMKKSSPQDLIGHYFSGSSDGPQAFDMMVAAGPFTTTTELTYKPLRDLLEVVRRNKPNSLVLIGPFVDETHPSIQDGSVDVTFEEIHEELMQMAKTAIADLPNTELMVVPSLRDVHHDKIFPQPPLEMPEDEKVHSFPNPVTFTMKEVVVGLTSNDILFDMSKQEASRGQTGDRIGRLANHLLEQRSYYPLYPPPRGVNVELERMDQIDLPISPDILLLPSDLRFFAKNVNGTLVVNPGRLTKHTHGGTYAHIVVHSPRRNDIPEGEKPIPHGVPQRSTVQIIRI